MDHHGLIYSFYQSFLPFFGTDFNAVVLFNIVDDKSEPFSKACISLIDSAALLRSMSMQPLTSVAARLTEP